MQACRDVDRNAKTHVRGMLGNAMVCVAVVEIGNVVLRWQMVLWSMNLEMSSWHRDWSALVDCGPSVPRKPIFGPTCLTLHHTCKVNKIQW